MLSGAPQDGVSTHDEDTSQVLVPLLGDVAKLLLVPGPRLVAARANPSREVAPRSECLRVRHGRVDRGGANDL